MTKVKNANRTVHFNCACGSWLKHWEKFAVKKSKLCAVNGCTNQAVDGVHVQKAAVADEQWFVVPFCEAHALSASELEISDEFKLVSANIALTCERW